MKALLLACSLTIVLLLFGASASAQTDRAASPRASAARVVVPRVVGMRMDRATRTLHNRRLRVNEECSGLFGCVVKANWWICHQSPRAGKRVRAYSVVVTYGERRGEC
jgi:hypothetical protein